MTKPGKLEFEKFIPHSPARVWRSLTVPELMKKWWVDSDIDPTIGHKFTLDMGAWGKQQCEVLAVEKERMISYSFSNFSRITWLLTPEGNGTKLSLIHDGFDLDSPLGKQAYEGMGKGWPGLIARISGVLSEMNES
jgi:uncharacterized protein YndB with AHSA1/START domain